jgi:predicted nucleic acid-binding protein
MIPHAYLDSSVLLRLLLGQADALAEWQEVEAGVVSALVEVECLRTLDRLCVTGAIGTDLALATHDAAQGRAARASGFEVLGL